MLRMKFLKPSWVSHEGHPIFSVDIHPDGSRFATGGQGADTGRVVIWNMAPVVNEADEKDENVPRMLCHMDNHLACVNCVRWSGSGKYLASGGDDKVIMIWQTGRYAGGSTGFGQGGKVVNVEHWRCVCSLRGHSGDVLDLAWSPHDAWLASCSVDNTVVVWNTLKWQEVIAVLKGHTGLVKGVSWDPVGRYLSSQSDDKSLRIWRTHDWQEETVVIEPFEECGGTTHTLRLSWSPDGQYLVSAHAMNNSGPTAQIIERDGWKTNKDFVGHRKAITCVRFNPNILSKSNKETGKVQHFCCCAIGSRDRSLSVWLTCLKRPLVVVHDLFSNSVLDISWSSHGYHLLICSWDGTVAYVDFSEEEIGKPISSDEKNILHQRLYGKSVMNHSHSMSTIVENPELLYLQEAKLLRDKTPLQNGDRTPNSVKNLESQVKTPVQFRVKGPIDKQIETRMPDGRRRITPLFIPMQVDDSDVPLPFNSRAQPTFSSSSESKSRIIIEKRDEITGTTTQTMFDLKRSVDATDSLPQPSSPQKEILKKTDATISEKSQSFSQPVVESTEVVVTEPDKPPPPQQQPTPLQPSKPILPSVDETPIYIPTKKKSELPTPGPGRPPEKRKPGRPPLSQLVVPVTPPQEKEPRLDRSAHTAGPSLHLPIPKIEKSTSIQVAGDKLDEPITYEMENNLNLGTGLIAHRLKRTSASECVWEVLLSSRGAAIAGSKYLVCVACEDSTLSIFNSHGKRLTSSIILSSPVTRLTCSNYFVMVITSRGAISVWNMQHFKAVIMNESLLPIMQGSQNLSIRSTGMTDAGHALVSLSTGKSYVFDVNLGSWTLVSSADDVVQQCSNHFRSLPAQDCINGKALPLASLQGQLHRRATNNLFLSNPSIQQAGTLSHLDSQIAASISLHSGKEYRFWLLTIVRYLAQEGLEDRLRDICENLFGPLVKSKSNSWQPYFLGLHRHDLLKEILPIIGSNLQLQRLFTEYKEQLDSVNL